MSAKSGRSGKSSRSRSRMEEMPVSYSEMAKMAYDLADKEKWPREKFLKLMADPHNLLEFFENRKMDGFSKPVDPVFERLIEDEKAR